MSAPADYLQKGTEFARKAIEADTAGRYQEAYTLYCNALEWLQMAVKYERNKRTNVRVTERMRRYLERAEQLKAVLQTGAAQGMPQTEQSGNATTAAAASASEGLMAQLEATLLQASPNVKWEDVAGLENVKMTLQNTVIMPLRQPQLFTKRRRPWTGVLLYGPPGTGKSYIAKALATEAGCTFLSVSSANLVSKFVGESARLVQAMFCLARKHAPCVIFIDEIETLCKDRSSTTGGGQSESSNQVVTEFLKNMDGVDSDMKGVLLLGATNLPWVLDLAIARRFQKKIYVPLPDASTRARIFQIHVGEDDAECPLDKEDYRKLAVVTEGYTASDIATVVSTALMQPLQRVHTSQFFKPVAAGGGKLLTPCRQTDAGAVQMEWTQVADGCIVAPALTKRDFVIALQTARPTLVASDLEKYAKWTEEHGEHGG